MTTPEWLLWQLADSAFPAGALAHSNGLEAAVQHGLVHDAASLEEFIHTAVGQTMRGVLVFVRTARNDPNTFPVADQHCDLFLSNHVSNRASRAQGRAFLAAAARIFDLAPVKLLAEQVRTTASPAHFAPVFGVVLNSLQISRIQTESLFLYLFMRSCISAAIRLGVAGPLEGQRIQSRMKFASVHSVRSVHSEPAVQTAPMLDLLQGNQDRLYSRLFQS